MNLVALFLKYCPKLKNALSYLSKLESKLKYPDRLAGPIAKAAKKIETTWDHACDKGWQFKVKLDKYYYEKIVSLLQVFIVCSTIFNQCNVSLLKVMCCCIRRIY